MTHHRVAAVGIVGAAIVMAACQQQDVATTGPRRAPAFNANVILTATPPTAVQRAGFGLPPGQVVAPNTPGGGVVVGTNFYSGDGANGFRHWKPVDPANQDPVTAGILVYDSDPSRSIGGGGVCVFFCQVGQVAYDGAQTVYVTAYDHGKGQPGALTIPGVWRLTVDSVAGYVQPVTPLAPNAGLAGNQPTSIALGPDGNLYVGFLKNGNIVRIVNPTVDPSDPLLGKTQIVQSVGTAPNGRPVRSVAFIGTDLYLGTSDGLSVIRNAVAPQCQGGCNGAPVADGFAGIAHVGLTSGAGILYMAINGSGVWRFSPSTQTSTLVASGGVDPASGATVAFAFVGGHSNLLQLDRLGNLWIGDDVSDGLTNFSGRIWTLTRSALASVP